MGRGQSLHWWFGFWPLSHHWSEPCDSQGAAFQISKHGFCPLGRPLVLFLCAKTVSKKQVNFFFSFKWLLKLSIQNSSAGSKISGFLSESKNCRSFVNRYFRSLGRAVRVGEGGGLWNIFLHNQSQRSSDINSRGSLIER